jgi:hypothetical protein
MFIKNLQFFIVCIFLLLPAGSMAQQASPSPRAVVAESTFEFKPVLEGTQVVHAFILKNQGDAPLNILKISSA